MLEGMGIRLGRQAGGSSWGTLASPMMQPGFVSASGRGPPEGRGAAWLARPACPEVRERLAQRLAQRPRQVGASVGRGRKQQRGSCPPRLSWVLWGCDLSHGGHRASRVHQWGLRGTRGRAVEGASIGAGRSPGWTE